MPFFLWESASEVYNYKWNCHHTFSKIPLKLIPFSRAPFYRSNSTAKRSAPKSCFSNAPCAPQGRPFPTGRERWRNWSRFPLFPIFWRRAFGAQREPLEAEWMRAANRHWSYIPARGYWRWRCGNIESGCYSHLDPLSLSLLFPPICCPPELPPSVSKGRIEFKAVIGRSWAWNRKAIGFDAGVSRDIKTGLPLSLIVRLSIWNQRQLSSVRGIILMGGEKAARIKENYKVDCPAIVHRLCLILHQCALYMIAVFDHQISANYLHEETWSHIVRFCALLARLIYNRILSVSHNVVKFSNDISHTFGKYTTWSTNYGCVFANDSTMP